MAMEAYARKREALVVRWGAFGDVGMYLTMPQKQREAELRYWVPLESGSVGELIEGARRTGEREVGVFGVKWEKFPLRGAAIYKRLQEEKEGEREGGGSRKKKKERETVENMDAEVVQAVREVLGMEEGDGLDEDAALQDLGFDSMMSVELSGRLGELTGKQVAATVAYDYPSVRQLKRHVAEVTQEQASVSSVKLVESDRSSKNVAIMGGSCRFGSEKSVGELQDPFLKKALNLAVDGTDRVKRVVDVARAEIAGEALVRSLEIGAPTFAGERRELVVDGETLVLTIARSN